MTDKPRIDAENIRSALRRISTALKDKSNAMQPDREMRDQIFLPAAAHIDMALNYMLESGINTEGAAIECQAALNLLGTHDELQLKLDDLVAVNNGKATLRY